MADQNQKNNLIEESGLNNNDNEFYYHYRSESEKRYLQTIVCSDLKLFYETVCSYEKNKDNQNCEDLFLHLKLYCKK